MTKPGSFKREKFHEIASKMNGSERIKTLAELRLAIGQLTENQSRFCDKFIDAGEYDEAHSECAKIRIELGLAFERCGDAEQDVEELDATIDRLYERMTMLESFDTDDEGDDDQARNGSVQGLSASRLSFWIGLPIAVLLYVVACLVAGHLLTASEWRSPAAFLGWAVPLGLSAGLLLSVYREYLPGSKLRFVRWCLSGMASVSVMFWFAGSVLCAWFFAYVWQSAYLPDSTQDPIATAVLTVVPPLWCFAGLRLWTRSQGWSGFVVKLALFVDAIGLTLVTGYLCDAPFGQHPFKPIEHWHSMSCLAATYCLFMSDRFMAFVMKREIFRSLVLIPAMSLVLTTAFMKTDGTIRLPETPAQAEGAIPVPVVRPPRRRPRKHRVHPISLSVPATDELSPAILMPVLSPLTRIRIYVRQRIASGKAKLVHLFYTYRIWIFPLLLVSLTALTGKKKTTIEDARREAHGISGPNVYGAAGLASKKDAKNRGWL